ncbi:MAG: ElyC/SanA/YdcF family protein [Patescibacteria group bacterium]
MRNEKAIVVVVLGYGCHLTKPMRVYLDNVAHFVGARNVAAIVTTGGYTNKKTAPGISEAMMMADYLKRNGVTTIILQEKEAQTTAENLKNVDRMLAYHHLRGRPIVIFCDEAHKLKVKLLSYFILGHIPHIWAHRVTGEFATKLKQVLIATPLNVLALWFPSLERMECERRERIMRNS